MIRQKLEQTQIGRSQDFRWRGGDISRLEGFSDAVFAFAITLLIVSLEVPRSFDQLMVSIQGFPAFSVTFAAILGIWFAHYVFFRRYGLNDGTTMLLNFVLLFVVLFYIYPLKFLATLLISHLLLNVVLGLGLHVDIVIRGGQWTELMIIYGFGFLAVFLIFCLFHLHAYRRRAELQLNALESYQTRSSVIAYGICVAAALFSLAIASIGGPLATMLSGWVYALIGPAQAIYGVISRRQGERIRRQMLAASADALT